MFSVPTNVLVVVAHPDDEVIGMGGTIAKLTSSGISVHIGFLSSGVGSRDFEGDAEAQARRKAAFDCCDILGANIEFFEDYPTLRFDTVPSLNLAKSVSKMIDAVKPDLIFTHHGGDLNMDHRLTAQAVLVASRPQPDTLIQGVYSFDVLSSTEWAHESLYPQYSPNMFVDVNEYLETALLAYKAYEAEVREEPHARSVNSLKLRMERRGREVGLYAADAFCTLRYICR